MLARALPCCDDVASLDAGAGADLVLEGHLDPRLEGHRAHRQVRQDHLVEHRRIHHLERRLDVVHQIRRRLDVDHRRQDVDHLLQDVHLKVERADERPVEAEWAYQSQKQVGDGVEADWAYRYQRSEDVVAQQGAEPDRRRGDERAQKERKEQQLLRFPHHLRVPRGPLPRGRELVPGLMAPGQPELEFHRIGQVAWALPLVQVQLPLRLPRNLRAQQLLEPSRTDRLLASRRPSLPLQPSLLVPFWQALLAEPHGEDRQRPPSGGLGQPVRPQSRTSGS